MSRVGLIKGILEIIGVKTEDDVVRTDSSMLGLVLARLRLKVIEYDVKEMTMILQMSKRSPETTLGDLQGDQSKVQLHKSWPFIVSQEE
jgi:hypothetical protein